MRMETRFGLALDHKRLEPKVFLSLWSHTRTSMEYISRSTTLGIASTGMFAPIFMVVHVKA